MNKSAYENSTDYLAYYRAALHEEATKYCDPRRRMTIEGLITSMCAEAERRGIELGKLIERASRKKYAEAQKLERSKMSKVSK